MPFWIDHLLVLVLAVFFPVRAGTFGYRRLVLAPEPEIPRVRHALYTQALWLQWGLAAFTAGLWLWQGRTWDEIGLSPRHPTGWIWGLGLAALLAIGSWVQQKRAARDPEALEQVLRRVSQVERMLPHAAEELKTFYALSATAGFCEELLYRGYLMWYLEHWMGLVPTLAGSSILFGVGHAYQGWRGVVTTGLFGGLLGVLYLVTGSLVTPMLVHALVDWHSGRLAYAALQMRASLPPTPAIEA